MRNYDVGTNQESNDTLTCQQCRTILHSGLCLEYLVKERELLHSFRNAKKDCVEAGCECCVYLVNWRVGFYACAVIGVESAARSQTESIFCQTGRMDGRPTSQFLEKM